MMDVAVGTSTLSESFKAVDLGASARGVTSASLKALLRATVRVVVVSLQCMTFNSSSYATHDLALRLLPFTSEYLVVSV